MLIRITAPHFVAGVDTCKMSTSVLGWEEDGYDNDCAPIVKYMRHWKPYKIKLYCRSKGWGYYPYKKEGGMIWNG